MLDDRLVPKPLWCPSLLYGIDGVAVAHEKPSGTPQPKDTGAFGKLNVWQVQRARETSTHGRLRCV